MLNGREKLNYFKLCLAEQLYICVCVYCVNCVIAYWFYNAYWT